MDYLYETIKKILKILKIILLVWCVLLLAWIINNFKNIDSLNFLVYFPCFIKTIMRSTNFMKIIEEDCNNFTQNYLLFVRS